MTKESQNRHGPGRDKNPGPEQPATHPSGQERQKQYQRTHEQALSDKEVRMGGAVPDTDNNLSRVP